MATMDLGQMREELCLALRNADLFGSTATSRTIRGVTAGTYSGTATASQTVITLGQTAVKNIRTFTVNSVAQVFITDYTVNWNTGVITMVTGMTVGHAISVSFDYGSSDKIYPDMPRDDITLTSFPRVGIETTSISTQPFGLGGMTHISDVMFTVIAWVSANKDSAIASSYGGITDLATLMKNIRDAIRTNAKSFASFQYITPQGTGPVRKGKNDKGLQQTADYNVKFKIE